jgi:hypothetical protein
MTILEHTLDFCKKHLLKYRINSDNYVIVHGNVYLDNRLGDMKKLPIKFEKVSGSFHCNGNKLTTLEGCPKYVFGNFYCNGNKLTTLEGCPKHVGENFICDIITHHVLGNVQGNIFCKKNKRIVI